jgi:hypothetical protein
MAFARSTVESRPASPPRWSDFPAIDDLLAWSGRGVSTGRTWVVSPSKAALRTRWCRLLEASGDDRRRLFVEGRRLRTIDAAVEEGLPGYPASGRTLADETRSAPAPIRYARRSFDRQWLIPDRRLIDRPNTALWGLRTAPGQLFLTSSGAPLVAGGPALTATSLLPQFNHYNGQRGRVWPLWLDAEARDANTVEGLLPVLGETLGTEVSGVDLFAYLTALCAHPEYTRRFAPELASGVLRLPLTADARVFARGVALGHRVLRLHTLGDHRADEHGRDRSLEPLQCEGNAAPRLEVPIPQLAASRPEDAYYVPSTECLEVGEGVIAGVEPEVFGYEVGGMAVVDQWLAQRMPTDSRRRQSRLDLVTAPRWEAGWTTELLQVLHAITGLRALELEQGDLLDEVLDGPLVSMSDLEDAGVVPSMPPAQRRHGSSGGGAGTYSQAEVPALAE